MCKKTDSKRQEQDSRQKTKKEGLMPPVSRLPIALALQK